jgi:hypothetical protein
LLLAAVGVAPAAAQTSPSTNQPAPTSSRKTTETRPALPTFFGDTGLWFVPTAETLVRHKASVQLFRANWDERQGLTDVNNIGSPRRSASPIAIEVFGSFKSFVCDVAFGIPCFRRRDPVFAGVDQNYPYMRRNFSKTLGSTPVAGAKWSILSESRDDGASLAIRPVLEFPSGTQWGGTSDFAFHIDGVGK